MVRGVLGVALWLLPIFFYLRAYAESFLSPNKKQCRSSTVCCVTLKKKLPRTGVERSVYFVSTPRSRDLPACPSLSPPLGRTLGTSSSMFEWGRSALLLPLGALGGALAALLVAPRRARSVRPSALPRSAGDRGFRVVSPVACRLLARRVRVPCVLLACRFLFVRGVRGAHPFVWRRPGMEPATPSLSNCCSNH